MSHVLVLQHEEFETLGLIASALEDRGATCEYVRTYAGEPVPESIGESSGLVVMGGSMGVYQQDRFPYLAAEISLIKSALEERKPVLGVCLGSQLLAAALGSNVRASGRQEIGWYKVALSPEAKDDNLFGDAPSAFPVFHWHGDIFDLPAGAVPLASSVMTPLQAFRYGNDAYGLLFHLEVTAEIAGSMVQGFSDELAREGIDPQMLLKRTDEYLADLSSIGSVVFGRWADLLA